MNVCDGDAVGVVLGPLPILPSLSFLHYLPISLSPTLPSSLRHSCGSEVSVEILDLVPSAGLPLTLVPLPKQVVYVQCAAERQ